MTLIMTNIADAQAGKPLTYLTITLVSLFASFGGNGNTLGYVYRCLQREVRDIRRC